eukprot:TRINITY_DN5187_c0_g1_i4.p1 TRINITY_DN5187_c0_g1~~TRINITY_DN5187_c0_g1_i4.p1  ORF type:complete len:433 (-),score=182.68 TRINITY_DN5187_c0_g1_i4:1935-3233(-)
MDCFDDSIICIDDKVQALKETENAKQEVAEALYSAQRELRKLKTLLGKSKDEIESLTKINDQLAIENTKWSEQMDKVVKEKKESERYLKMAQDDLVRVQESLLQTRQINLAYENEIKVHKRLLEKQNLDANNWVEERKRFEETHNRLNRFIAEHKAEITTVNTQLEEERNEKAALQHALDKIVDDLSDVTSTKESIFKQWQESLQAMTKRDSALQATEEQSQKLKHELTIAHAREKSLQEENFRLDSEVKKLNFDLTTVRKEIAGLKATIHDQDQEKMTMEADVLSLEKVNANAEEEVKTLVRSNNTLKSENSDLARRLEAARASLVELNRKFDLNEKEGEIFEVSMERHTQQMSSEFEKERRDKNARIAELENANKMRSIQHRSLEQELSSATMENDVLTNNIKRLENKNSKLWKEIYSLTEQVVRVGVKE